jgi:hypothetical protein
MSDKDLTTKVKTVLHGEVLGPEDEGYEPRKKGKTAAQVMEEERKREKEEYIQEEIMFRNQYAHQNYYQNPYSNQGFYHSQNQYGNQQGSQGLFGCLLHISGLFPCKSCGKY